MTTFPRIYPGSLVLDVVDGDTVRVFCDLGGDIWWKVLCRLDGIAARELNEPGGPEAQAYLATLLPTNSVVIVRSLRWDKYAGRIIGIITRTTDGLNVAMQMVNDGYAMPWNGRGAQPKPLWPMP